MKKRCSKCGKKKSLDKFYRIRRGAENRAERCKICDRAAVKVYRKKLYQDLERLRVFREKRRAYATQNIVRLRLNERQRERNAGWRFGRLKERWEEQKGRCDRCGRSMKRTGHGSRVAHCDHDHQTKQIRSLLCSACNVKVHSISELKLTLAYLMRWGLTKEDVL